MIYFSWVYELAIWLATQLVPAEVTPEPVVICDLNGVEVQDGLTHMSGWSSSVSSTWSQIAREAGFGLL